MMENGKMMKEMDMDSWLRKMGKLLKGSGKKMSWLKKSNLNNLGWEIEYIWRCLILRLLDLSFLSSFMFLNS